MKKERKRDVFVRLLTNMWDLNAEFAVFAQREASIVLPLDLLCVAPPTVDFV